MRRRSRKIRRRRMVDEEEGEEEGEEAHAHTQAHPQLALSHAHIPCSPIHTHTVQGRDTTTQNKKVTRGCGTWSSQAQTALDSM
eukprot:2803731-Rhodomonas_salina.1